MEREARIALCKCREGKKTYGVRFEKSVNSWKYTWAFTIKESAAKREGYDNTKIIGDIYPDAKYPGCPYCKTRSFVICSCGKLNCNNQKQNKEFVCEWCGSAGTLVDYEGNGFQSGEDV